MFLDEPEEVAQILEKLLRSNKDDALLAFQIAFDLVENERQAFLLNVRDRLSVSTSRSQESGQPGHDDAAQNESPAASEDVAMTEGPHTSDVTVQQVDQSEAIYAERLKKIRGILSGETAIQLTLQFLYSHNKYDYTPFFFVIIIFFSAFIFVDFYKIYNLCRSDLLILKTIKQSVEMRNSVCHSATIYANAIMHAGTTVDTFLRENLVRRTIYSSNVSMVFLAF